MYLYQSVDNTEREADYETVVMNVKYGAEEQSKSEKDEDEVEEEEDKVEEEEDKVKEEHDEVEEEEKDKVEEEEGKVEEEHDEVEEEDEIEEEDKVEEEYDEVEEEDDIQEEEIDKSQEEDMWITAAVGDDETLMVEANDDEDNADNKIFQMLVVQLQNVPTMMSLIM